MPHSLSAKKRVRQDEKKKMRNLSKKREVRTWIKRTDELIEAGELEAAREAFNFTQKKLDKVARTNIFHHKNVARKKSRLARRLRLLEEGKLPTKAPTKGKSSRKKK